MKPAPACTKCSTPLPAQYFNSGQYSACLSCSSEVRIEVFPAYFREEAKGSGGEALLVDSEASCFYHPAKKAAVICSGCGRFLCSLCDCELDSAHYCPGCLEAAKEKGKIAAIENSRRCYDSLALQLALVGMIPIIFPYFTIFTASGAIFIAIRFWNAKTSIVRNPSHWRQITALILASLQLVGMIAMIGAIAYQILN